MSIIPVIAVVTCFIGAIAVWGDKKVPLWFKPCFSLACMIVGLIILLIF